MIPRTDSKIRVPQRGFSLAAAILVAGVCAGMPVQADDSTAPTVIPTVSALNMLENPRSKGLGGSGVALGRDIGLVQLNPAAANGSSPGSISFTGQRGIFGEQTGQVLASNQIPLGTIILGAGYYNAGETEMTLEDFTTKTVNTQRDFIGELGFATSPGWNVAVGATVKYMKSEMAEEFKADAIAVDIGAQVNLTRTLKAGMAVRNIGKGYRYLDESNAAPTSITMGLAAIIQMAESVGISITDADVAILTADAESMANAEFLSAQAGLEYRTFRVFSFRVGIRQSPYEAMRSISAGLGFMVTAPLGGRETRFRLDYAVEFGNQTFTQPHILGLTIEITEKIMESSSKEEAPPPAPVDMAPAYEAPPALPSIPDETPVPPETGEENIPNP